MIVSGDKHLLSLNGHVSQTGGVINAVGLTTVDAGTHDISLNNSANIFDNISLTGYNLTLLTGGGLTITSILDLVGGHANARGEAHHVLDVAGLLLLWALAGMPRPTGWRPASRHEHEVSRRALRAAASRRAEGDTLSDVG